MKCLPIKQPYAELIVSGIKTIETRNQNTNFRGQFLVYATKYEDKACCTTNIDSSNLVRGKIIGYVCLYDVKKYNTEQEFHLDARAHWVKPECRCKYGFLLKNAKRLGPIIPEFVRRGFFDYPPIDINSKIVTNAADS